MKKTLLCLALITSMNVFSLSPKNEALFHAINSMDYEAIEEALTNGANVNAINDWGDSPLDSWVISERKNYVKAIQLFLEQGAKIDKRVGCEILLSAVKHNHIKIVELLLASGVYLNPQDYDLHTALRWSIEYDRKEIVQLFIENGIDVNEPSTYVKTALHEAAIYGRIAIAQLLLENGADVNAQDDHLYTPLHWAAKFDNIEIAQLLLVNGADINAKTIYGNSVICGAIEDGSLPGGSAEMVELLLANGADVNTLDNYGQTPLYKAIGGNPHTKGRVNIVELLLDYGVDVNAIVSKKEKLTPLMLAVILKEKEIIKLLLSRGADREAVDFKGRSAFYWAKNDPEITHLLRT